MRINRPALFAVLVAGQVMGILPFLAFVHIDIVDDWVVLAVYCAITFAIGIALLIRSKPAENEPPNFKEYLHALLGQSAFAAGAAITGFFLYGVAYGLVRLAAFIADMAGYRLGWNPDNAGYWTSVPFTLLFTLFTFSFSRIPRTLFPEVPGVISAYDSLIRQGKLWLRLLLVLAALTLVVTTYLFALKSWWWYVIAIYLMAAGGAESMGVANRWSPTVAIGKDAIKAMAKLYSALGYAAVVSPRTKEKDAEIDQLLQGVDMLASLESEVLVIELKTPVRTSKAVSASDISILPITARALARYLSSNEQSQPTIAVHPVLVFVGREYTADLAMLADEEHIRLLQMPEETLREVLVTDDEGKLREIGTKYLVVNQEPSVPAAPMAASNAS